MNCKKCGKELNKESCFCHICGEPVEKAEQNIPEVMEAEKTEIVPDMSEALSPKNRKGLGKAAVMIAGGVLLIAGILALVFNFHTIRGWYIRSFQSPQDYLQFVIDGEMENSITGFAEKLSAFTADGLPKEAAYSNTLRLELGEALSQSLENDAGISLPESLSLSALTVFDEGKMQADVSLLLADKHLIGGEAYFDIQNGKVWLNLPDLSQEPLYLCLKGQHSDAEYGFDAAGELLQILEEEKEAISHIYKELSGITTEILEAEELSRQTLTLKDVTQEVTVLKVTQHTENISAVEAQALENLLNDPKVLRLLERLSGPLARLCGESDLNLVDVVRQTLDGMDGEATFAPADDQEIYFYVDDNHNLIGKKLIYQGQAVYEEIKLEQNERTVTRWRLQGYCYEGDYTVHDGLYTGEYKIYDGDNLAVDIVFNSLGINEGVMNGMAQLTIVGDYLYETTGSVSPDVDVTLSFGGNKDTSDAMLRFRVGGIEALSLTLTSETLPKQPVYLPEGGVDMLDSDAVAQWVLALDYEALFSNLVEAGLPDELRPLFLGTEEES